MASTYTEGTRIKEEEKKKRRRGSEKLDEK
jgi:hypothetical protein